MNKKTDFHLSISLWTKHPGSTTSPFSCLQGIDKFVGMHFIPDDECIPNNVTVKHHFTQSISFYSEEWQKDKSMGRRGIFLFHKSFNN